MKHFYAVLLLLCVLCGAATAEETLTPGTQTQRGFVNDNVLHSDIGDIQFRRRRDRLADHGYTPRSVHRVSCDQLPVGW